MLSFILISASNLSFSSVVGVVIEGVVVVCVVVVGVVVVGVVVVGVVVVVVGVDMVLSQHVFKEGKDLASAHSLCCQKKVSGASSCPKYVPKLLLLGLLVRLPLPGGSVPACTAGRSDHTTRF